MNFKSKLDLLHTLDAEINSQLLMLEELKTAAAKTTPVMHFAPSGHGGNSRSMESLAVKIADMSKDINAKTDEFVDLKRELIDTISAIPDPRYRNVLLLRGIQGLSWKETAKKMHFSFAHVRELWKDAILAAEKAYAFENQHNSAIISNNQHVENGVIT